MWSLDSHLSMYVNLCWAALTSRVLCAFVTNVLKLQIAPSCDAVGQLASQYGEAFVKCMWGVAVSFSLSVPSLASASAISLPMMHV